MAKIKILRLAEEPLWLQSSTIEAGLRVEISHEGTSMHVRFLEGHPAHARGMKHVTFGRWDYAVYDEDEPAKGAKK